MKKIFKYFGLILSVVLVGALASCNKEGGSESADLGLHIKVFFPTKVVAGQPMTINGSGFSDVTEVVFPGGVTVAKSGFELVSDEMIRVTAPAGISAAGGPLAVRTADDEAESKMSLKLGNPVVSGYSKQAGESVEFGEVFYIYGQDLEFLSSVELLDAEGNTNVIPESMFYRKGTSTVGFKVPMNTLEGTFPGKVKSLDGKTFDIPELTYAPPAGGGHWEQKEFVLYEGETLFDAWSATLVIEPAKFADVVEGGVIRVYYKDKGSDYNSIFKHVDSWGDWDELQGLKKEYDGFFESTVTPEVIEELKTQGLRFQGLGFTITSVILSQNMWIDEGGEEPQKEEIIWEGETVFDSWSATIVIDAAKFAQAKEGNTIRVFIKDKDDTYNAIFKHVDSWGDWDELQALKKDTDEYFESTVTAEVLDELKSAGLRFQGLGFTIVEVHLIP
jgi:hypothetical protein